MSSTPLTGPTLTNPPDQATATSSNVVKLQYTTAPAFFRNPYKARHFFDSLGYALEGLAYVVRHERNFQIHLAMGSSAVGLGLLTQLSGYEWLALCLVCALVLFAEAMNTAIELVVDMITHGEFDARAKVVKDLSAGACLLCALAALGVGSLIFIPHWMHFS